MVLKNVYLFIALLLFTLLLYAGIINTPFFSDDFHVIYRLQQNDFDAVIFFRPLSDISIYLDYLIWGNHAPGFHLTSILIHAITGFLVYLVAAGIFGLTAIAPRLVSPYAVISAVLFLAYPFHNEAVVWIVGRGVLLATTFTLLALHVLLKANGRWWWGAVAAVLYGIALLGYESPLPFPAIAAVIMVAGKRPIRHVVLSLGFLLVILLVYAFIRVLYLGNLAGDAAYFGLQFSAKTLVLNLCRLVERSLLPPLANHVYAMILALLLFAGGVLVYRRKVKAADPFMPAFLLMFIVALLPVITLGIDTHDSEGERFLYFPSVFFIISLVYFMHKVSGGLYKTVAFCGVLLYFLACLAISNRYWQKAGAIIRSVTGSAAAFHTTGTLYVIGLPDNLKGAFIFRNGFREAFGVMGRPLSARKVVVLSTSELAGKTPQRFLIQTGTNGSTCRITDTREHQEYTAQKGDKIVLFSQERFRVVDCP